MSLEGELVGVFSWGAIGFGATKSREITSRGYARAISAFRQYLTSEKFTSFEIIPDSKYSAQLSGSDIIVRIMLWQLEFFVS